MDSKLLGAVTAGLALALASCGGSGTLSRADFVKQASVICKRRSALVASAQRTHRGDFRAVARAAMPGFKRSLDELAALRAPADAKARLAEIVSIEHRQLAQIEAALAGRRVAADPNSAATNDRQATLKQSLGLRACI
jgi:hypothetical protein